MLNLEEKKNDETLNHNHFGLKTSAFVNTSICDQSEKNNVSLQKNMLINNLKTNNTNGNEAKKTKHTQTNLSKRNNEMNNKKETNVSKHKEGGEEEKKKRTITNMHDEKKGKTVEQNIIGCKKGMGVVRIEKGKEVKKDLDVEINEKEGKELKTETMKNASLEEALKESIQAKRNVKQLDDMYMEELHIKKCGLSSFFCCQSNKKKQSKVEKTCTNGVVAIEDENGKEVKNIDWLIYTIRYMDYRRLRRRFNGIRKPISKKIVFIITIFCLVLISWKNILTSYDEGMYIISFKIKNDVVFFIEAVFALIGIVIFAKFQTRLSLNWPIYASYIFIILAAVILLFSGNEKYESDSISEHILIIYGIVQLLLIIIVKIIIFIGPLLAAYGLFCPCTEHCRILKKKVSTNKLNITISRYNDLAGMCGNNFCCLCLCVYRSFYRAIRFFYNRCARCRFQINNGKLKRAPFSHQLRYKGKTDIYGRPHGYGEWIEDHSYGEKLRGFWFHGYPVGPFISQEIGSGSLFVNTRVGFVVSLEKDLTDIRFGVSCTECSISGHFFSDFPLTHFFNPHIEKNVNGRIPQNRYDIIVKDILKEDYESILSYDLKWCFNMLKINSGHTVESTSSKCVITLDHATKSLRVNNFKRRTPIKRKQNVLDEITVKLVKLSKYKKRKRILKKNKDGKGMKNTRNTSSDNLSLHWKTNKPASLEHLIEDTNKQTSSVFFEEPEVYNKTKEKNNGVANVNVKNMKELEKGEKTRKEKIPKGYVTKIDMLESPVLNTIRKKESVQVCKSEIFDNPFNFFNLKEKGETDFSNCKSKRVTLHAEENNTHLLKPHNKRSNTDVNCFSPCKEENGVELNTQNGASNLMEKSKGGAWNGEKNHIPFDLMKDNESDRYGDIIGDYHIKKNMYIRFQKEDLLGESNKELLKGNEETKNRENLRLIEKTGKTSYRKKRLKRGLEKATRKQSLQGGPEEKGDIVSNRETTNIDFLKLKTREENTTEGNDECEKHASNKLCSAYEFEPTDIALDKNRTKSSGTRRIGTNKIIAHLKDNYKESINKKIKKINMSKSQHGKHKSFTSKQKMKSDLVKKKSLMFLSPRNIQFDNMFRSKNSLKGKNENLLESFSKRMKNLGDAFNVNGFHESNTGTQKKKLNKKIAQVFEEEDEWENYQQQNNQKIVVDGWKSLSLKRHLTVMPDEIVIYIHGYNVNLAQGCSQLAHLVSFSKLPSYIQPFVFHWEGSMWGPFSALSYPVAKKRAEVPMLGEAFKNFIQRLIDLDIKNIHIISHSCGSRLFFNGFEKCVRDGLFYNMLEDEELEPQNGFTYNEKNRMKKKENSSHSQESESSQEEDYIISSGDSVFSDIEESFCNEEQKTKMKQPNRNQKKNQKKKIFVKTAILINPDYSLKKFLEKDFFLIRTHCNHIVMYGDTRDQALTYAETWNREKSLGKRIFKLKLPLYKVHGFHDYLNLKSNSNKHFVDSYEEKYRLCDSLLFPNSTQKQPKVCETSEDEEEKESIEKEGIKKKKKKVNHNGQYKKRKKKEKNIYEEDGDIDGLMKANDHDRDYKRKELNLSANESCDEISITSDDGVYNELNEKFLRTVEFSDSSFRSFKTKKKWNFINVFRRLIRGNRDSLCRTHVYYNNKNGSETNNKNNVDITNASNNIVISNSDSGKDVFNVIHNNSDMNCSFVGNSVQQFNVNEHGDISGRLPLKIGVKSTRNNKGSERNLPAQVFMKTDTVYISFDKYAWLDMDVIDTTFVETNVDFLKHSFYQVKREIIDDIREVMISNVRARERVSRLDRRRGNVFVLRVAPAGVGSLHR